MQASYDGEEVTCQAGVEIVNTNGKSINADAASEVVTEIKFPNTYLNKWDSIQHLSDLGHMIVQSFTKLS